MYENRRPQREFQSIFQAASCPMQNHSGRRVQNLVKRAAIRPFNFSIYQMHGFPERNLLNLLAVLSILFAVTGCFWSESRTSGNEQQLEQIDESENTESNSHSAPGKASLQKDGGDFIVEHVGVTAPGLMEIDRQVREEKLLEDAAEKLNQALMLPRDIFLRTKDCKDVNAYYDPNDRSVTMCYELMEHFFRTFKSTGLPDEKAYEKMNDAVRFVFLHEIGHALIDQYKLPVAGNEEDAADRCSAFINLKELGEEGVRAVFAAADAFAIESKQGDNSRRNLADEHLLREQRFYNSLCMIYGSNPEKHSKVVSGGYLPKERAAKCQIEYQRTVDSWVSLLGPWRKN